LATTLGVLAQTGGDVPAAWVTPHTANGQPDLQGHWTNETYTPLERPAELGDKALFTPAEAAAFFQSKVDDLNAQAATDIHYDDAIWQAENYEKVASRRTSLIVDPPNGRLPPLNAQGEDRLPRHQLQQLRLSGQHLHRQQHEAHERPRRRQRPGCGRFDQRQQFVVDGIQRARPGQPVTPTLVTATTQPAQPATQPVASGK
jgi:hypothetical protein